MLSSLLRILSLCFSKISSSSAVEEALAVAPVVEPVPNSNVVCSPPSTEVMVEEVVLTSTREVVPSRMVLGTTPRPFERMGESL